MMEYSTIITNGILEQTKVKIAKEFYFRILLNPVLYFKTSEIDLDRGYLRQNLCSVLARSLTTKSNEEFLRVCLDSSNS